MEIRRLNSLRGLAVTIVLLSHYSNATNAWGKLAGVGAGQLGVMLFFMLSGFLMSLLYWESKPTSENLWSYAISRTARVMPLYVIIVLASFFTGFPYHQIDGIKSLLSHLLMLSGKSVLWTIPVEIQFYLIFLLSWRYLRYRPRLLSAAMLASFVIPYFARFPSGAHTVFGLTVSTALLKGLPYFVVGAAFGQLYRRTQGVLPWAHWGFLASLILIPMMFPQVSLILFGSRHAPWRDAGGLIIVAIVFFSVVFLVPDRSRVLENRLGDFLGKISYSLYLLHLPILNSIAKTSLAGNHVLGLTTFLATAVIVATVSYFLIENPSRRIIRRLLSRSQKQDVAADAIGVQ